MKPLIITLLLLCSAVCWGEDNPDPSPIGIATKLQNMDKEIKDIKDSIDKIYTMVTDLEVKFMGQARYNQIYDPTNEGEVAKQKLHDKEVIKQLQEQNRMLINGVKNIEKLSNPTKE